MKKAAEYFYIRVYFEDKAAISSKPAHIFVLEPHDILPVSIFAFSGTNTINTTTTTTTTTININIYTTIRLL